MTAPVTLGPSASAQWLGAPEHLAMVLSRYRLASALIGRARDVLDVGCGEGIGSRLLARDRASYTGVDPDADALETAQRLHPSGRFVVGTVGQPLDGLAAGYDAVVALDVIEHVAADDADGWMTAIVDLLRPDGVLVVGTPSASFDHLASPQSRAAHVKTYRHDELYGLLGARFMVVQSFGMADVALHLGHPDARHYLLMAGVGCR